jgi:glucose-6-phosphate-specific signal transduction histidine kinase
LGAGKIEFRQWRAKAMLVQLLVEYRYFAYGGLVAAALLAIAILISTGITPFDRNGPLVIVVSLLSPSSLFAIAMYGNSRQRNTSQKAGGKP